jgi:hypothetical protein
MCQLFTVHWTLTPRVPPQPWIVCGGCGGLRPFEASGRFRLNANGKKLDAWLIYKCRTCGATWNRPLFERRAVRDLAPEILEALHANDPARIRAHAFDLAGLKRHARRVDTFADHDLVKTGPLAPEGWTALEIALTVTDPVAVRLDRLLASELAIPRARLAVLASSGGLRVDPDRKDALRREPATGTRILVVPSGEEERWALAAGAVR